MRKGIISFLTVCFIATGCNAAQKTDEFTTKSGKTVKITCIKHASLEISYDGVEIQVDPVGIGIKPETDYGQFPKANLILITHEHRDHLDAEAIRLLTGETTRLITNQRCADILNQGEVMANGDHLALADGITLDAVPAYNITEGRTQFHPQGRDNGYILTLDGLRIYIAGDTEDIPEMADIHDIDVAFLPCNQPYTMTPQQLVRAARIIRPKVVFPYHFGQTDVTPLPAQLEADHIDVRLRHYE